MKQIVTITIILILACAALASWPSVAVQRTVAPLLPTYVWGGTPLKEVDVGSLSTNMERAQYLRAAAHRQYALVELYESGIVTVQGYTFTATPQTITAIKQEFAALRTRIKACEDLVTAD